MLQIVLFCGEESPILIETNTTEQLNIVNVQNGQKHTIQSNGTTLGNSIFQRIWVRSRQFIFNL